jgi:hypothetical protein
MFLLIVCHSNLNPHTENLTPTWYDLIYKCIDLQKRKTFKPLPRSFNIINSVNHFFDNDIARSLLELSKDKLAITEPSKRISRRTFLPSAHFFPSSSKSQASAPSKNALSSSFERSIFLYSYDSQSGATSTTGWSIGVSHEREVFV